MVGAGCTNGTLDVWDSSAKDGTIKLLKSVLLADPLGPNNSQQKAVQAHQAVLEPTGRFFVVNERGADTISVIDSDNDTFDVVNKVRVEPPGCGPRHGTFIKSGDGKIATHYVFVCELVNLIQLYTVEYLPTTLKLSHVQSLSTFGDDIPPKNPTVLAADANKMFAAAGECIVASNQRDIYASNRLTGNDADSIVRFGLVRDPICDDKASLKFGESISSFGIMPRMFSLSLNQSVLFSTNQNNGTGLLAYRRDAQGKLSVIEESKVDIEEFRVSKLLPGPEFVQQI